MELECATLDSIDCAITKYARAGHVIGEATGGPWATLQVRRRVFRIDCDLLESLALYVKAMCVQKLPFILLADIDDHEQRIAEAYTRRCKKEPNLRKLLKKFPERALIMELQEIALVVPHGDIWLDTRDFRCVWFMRHSIDGVPALRLITEHDDALREISEIASDTIGYVSQTQVSLCLAICTLDQGLPQLAICVYSGGLKLDTDTLDPISCPSVVEVLAHTLPKHMLLIARAGTKRTRGESLSLSAYSPNGIAHVTCRKMLWCFDITRIPDNELLEVMRSRAGQHHLGFTVHELHRQIGDSHKRRTQTSRDIKSSTCLLYTSDAADE